MNSITTSVLLVFLLLLGTASATTVTAATQLSRLYVSFCPTDFTNAIAVVDVDVATGEWKVVGTSKMPGGVFGCSADYSPTFSFNPANRSEVILDFTTDTGYFVKVAVSPTGEVSTSHFTSRSLFFTGFLSFQVTDKTPDTYVGMTGTVTQDGFCSDACIGYGIQQLAGSEREKATPLPFRAISDDTSFLDRTNGIFYAQASHEIPNSEGRRSACNAPQDWMDCMLQINATTGELLQATYNNNEHVYRFGIASAPAMSPSSSHRGGSGGGPVVSAFVVGMNARCNRSQTETSYAFASVDLSTSNFALISCVSNSVVIDTDEWIASFSQDGQVYVTSSGNGEGDPPQFLSYHVASGKVMVNTQLKGLAEALKAKMGLIFVWAVQVLPAS